MLTNRRSLQVLTGLALLAVLACSISNSPASPPAPPPSPTTVVPAGGTADNGQSLAWLKVYSSVPNPPDQLENGIDRFVVQAVAAA